jgi:helix-turn-helix protein
MFEIGSSLRDARERRRIGLAQAEQATKVRVKYLRALEEEEFDQLPAGTYVKGFLRTYADYLGLDGQLYVDEYNSRFERTDRADLLARRSSRRPQERNRRLERNVILAALGLIVVVTVVVISAWKSSGQDAEAPKAHHAKAKAVRHTVAPPVPYLTIRAVRGPSYVAVRKGGPAGAVLFDGTILRGHAEPFNGKRFWVNVSSPENLVIRVGGERVHVTGLKPQVITVTPSGWQAR